jgi:hypothetical protein
VLLDLAFGVLRLGQNPARQNTTGASAPVLFGISLELRLLSGRSLIDASIDIILISVEGIT